MKILLVEPAFPRASKSKNHDDFLPIGLLKLAAYHRKRGDSICLIRGKREMKDIHFEHPNGRISKKREPDQILITSYFTYWSKYVRSAVSYYRKLFPVAKIIVGGIYASLMPKHCKKYTKCDEVFVGVHEEAEKCRPVYYYLEKHYGPIDYQIIHTSRGCIRRCEFCGVYKIEPKFTYKESINEEIVKRRLVFYDNNLLANPHIESILTELAYLKSNNKIFSCDSQSGIDGRILEKHPDYAFLLKKAGFKEIRISWDGKLEEADHIKKQIDLLKEAGYDNTNHVFVFMIYNWDVPYEEMEKKRIKCWEWKVQIADCRYRPLSQKDDRYSGQKFRTGQTGRDYHIHREGGWTDKKIRAFRKHIRSQNICVRMNLQFYSNTIERSYLNKNITLKLIEIARSYPKNKLEPILEALKIPYWFPENFDGNGYYKTKDEIFEEYEKITNKRALIHGNQRTHAFLQWRNRIQREVFNQYLKY